MLGLASPPTSASTKFALSSNTKRFLLVGWLLFSGSLCLSSWSPLPSSSTFPSSFGRRAAIDLDQVPLAAAAVEPTPLPDIWKGRRIALREDAGFHEEVFGALIYSLKKSGVEPRIFRNQGFRFGFLQAVADFWSKPSWEPTENGAFDKAVLENEVDLLLLATCSLQIDPLLPLLLDPRTKVHVGCLTHWGSDPHNNNERYAALADTGRLSIVTLSDHVEEFVQHLLGNMAAEDEGGMGKAWDKIDVSTFVPTFPVDAVQRVHQTKLQPTHFPRTLAIQGNISSSRRDYASVLRSLHAMLLRNPTEWGYKWSKARPEDQVLVPIDEPGASEPFELHLMGNLEEQLEIPAVMAGIVHIHQGQQYEDYYATLAKMDALLPAFSHGGYVWDMASSSIGAALIAEIPVLCAPDISQKYAYLSGPSLLPHPNSMDPLEAVRQYRLGANPAKGMRRGRNVEGRGQSWDDFLEDVDRRNIGVWEQLLARLD